MNMYIFDFERKSNFNQDVSILLGVQIVPTCAMVKCSTIGQFIKPR